MAKTARIGKKDANGVTAPFMLDGAMGGPTF